MWILHVYKRGVLYIKRLYIEYGQRQQWLEAAVTRGFRMRQLTKELFPCPYNFQDEATLYTNTILWGVLYPSTFSIAYYEKFYILKFWFCCVEIYKQNNCLEDIKYKWRWKRLKREEAGVYTWFETMKPNILTIVFFN